MYSRKKNRIIKHFDFMILDMISVSLALFIAYSIRHGFGTGYAVADYRNLGIMMLIFDVLIVFFRNSYKDVIRRGYLKEMWASVTHFSLIMAGIFLYLFLIKRSEYFSRTTLMWTWFLGIILMYLFRIALKKWLRIRIMQKEKLISVLTVLSVDSAENVLHELKNRKYKDYDLAGIILLGGDGGGIQNISGIPVVANASDYKEYIKNNVVDELFVNITSGYRIAEEIMESCVRMGITVHQSLNGFVNGAGNKVVEEFAGYTVLTSSIKVAAYSDLFLKRCMDIFGGIVGLLVTAIMFPFVAAAIKRKSPGPVLFCQERIGRNGRKIKIYKFRSMEVDAEKKKSELLEQNEMSGQMFKVKDDPRIIPGVGEFIRKTSLDEFPQFWNVLKGDMSLVGTRPPTVEEYEQYDMHHLVRMSIKPGLTGLWQVSGRNEITDFEEVVKLDTKYIENWNLSLDIKILLKTVAVMFQGSGE